MEAKTPLHLEDLKIGDTFISFYRTKRAKFYTVQSEVTKYPKGGWYRVCKSVSDEKIVKLGAFSSVVKIEQ